jgi:hypothetical protein
VTALRKELRFGSQSITQLFGSLINLAFQATGETLIHGDKRRERRQAGDDFSGRSRSCSWVIDQHR